MTLTTQALAKQLIDVDIEMALHQEILINAFRVGPRSRFFRWACQLTFKDILSKK